MKTLIRMPSKFFADEGGVTSIEYALVMTLIAIVIAISLVNSGGSIDTIFQKIGDCIAHPGVLTMCQ